MYLVLDIVDYVPGVARGLTDGHHLGALTQMAPPDSSHTAVHQTLFCIIFVFFVFLMFSHTNGTTKLISCCCSRILYFFSSKICFEFYFPCEHS